MMRVRIARASVIALAVAACRGEPRTDVTFTPAQGERRQVTRSADGSEAATLLIGTLTDGVQRVQLLADARGKVLLAIDRADSATMPVVAAVSARPLMEWLTTARQWTTNAGAAATTSQPNSVVTETIDLNPIVMREEGSGFYSLRLTRGSAADSSVHVQVDAPGGTAGFRSVTSRTVSAFLEGMGAAADSAIVMAAGKVTP